MDEKLNSPTSPEPRGRAVEEKSSQSHEGRTHRDHHSRDRERDREHHHHHHSESRDHLRRSRDSRDHHDHHSSHHHSSHDRDRERDHLRKSRDRDHHDHHSSHHSSHDRERDHHHLSSSHSRDRDHHEHHSSHHRDYHHQARKIIQKCLAEDIATEKLQELWNLYDIKKRGCLGEHEGTKFLKDVWCVHAKLHDSKICDLLPKELSEQEALKVSFQGLAGPDGTLCWESFFRFMKSGAGSEKKSPDRSPSPENESTTKQTNPFSCPDLSTTKKMGSQANLHSNREHTNSPRYASHSHTSSHHSTHHSSHHHAHHHSRRAHSTHHLSRGRSEDDLKHVAEQLTELTKKVLTLEQERASTQPLLRTVS